MSVRCLSAAIVVGALSIGPACASQDIDPFDYRVSKFVLLTQPSVQSALHLSASQLTAIQGYEATYRKVVTSSFERGPRGSTRAFARRTRRTKILGGLRWCMVLQLNHKQLERLRQISLQTQGPAALATRDVARRVGLNEYQTAEIRSIVSRSNALEDRLNRELLRISTPSMLGAKAPSSRDSKHSVDTPSHNQGEILGQLELNRSRMESQVLSILSPAQKEIWNRLNGPKLAR